MNIDDSKPGGASMARLREALFSHHRTSTCADFKGIRTIAVAALNTRLLSAVVAQVTGGRRAARVCRSMLTTITHGAISSSATKSEPPEFQRAGA